MNPLLLVAATLAAPAAVPAVPSAKPVAAVPVSPAATPAVKHRRQRRRAALSPVLRTLTIANRTATLEPAAPGFINAVQIYPYADGALYKVYTAPERVTDIALQPGEALARSRRPIRSGG
jgi:type IV secretion system protein VirB9